MKLRERPIAAVLVEVALTGFSGNVSVAGLTSREPIAVDIHVEEGAITHCTGYLGDREVSDDECLDIVMSAECINCGAELTMLPPERIIRKYRRPILSRKPIISNRIDSTSNNLKEKVRPAEIILKGRMVMLMRAKVEDGLRALAELSLTNATAMLATADDDRLVVISKDGSIMAAYLRLGEAEYLGLKALNKASQAIGNHALIQIFSLPEEIAHTVIEGSNESSAGSEANEAPSLTGSLDADEG